MPRHSAAIRDAMNNARVDAIDVGGGSAVLQARTGPAPASITDPAAGTLLAEWALPAPAFGASAGGVATAGAIGDVEGLAAGDVGHYRVLDRAGAVCWDSNDVADTGSTGLVLSTLTVSVGLTMQVTSWTSTQPAGTP